MYARKFRQGARHAGIPRRLPRVRAEVSTRSKTCRYPEAVAPCTRGSFVERNHGGGQGGGCPVYARKFLGGYFPRGGRTRLPRVRTEVSTRLCRYRGLTLVAPCTHGSFANTGTAPTDDNGCPVYARKFPPPGRGTSLPAWLPRVRTEVSVYSVQDDHDVSVAPCTHGSFSLLALVHAFDKGCPVYVRISSAASFTSPSAISAPSAVNLPSFPRRYCPREDENPAPGAPPF